MRACTQVWTLLKVQVFLSLALVSQPEMAVTKCPETQPLVVASPGRPNCMNIVPFHQERAVKRVL